MEVNNVTGTYTSAAKAVETEDEKKNKKVQDEQNQENKVKERDFEDKVELTKTDDFDDAAIQEKANNYAANILANPKLTDEARELIQQYMATFDAAKFIKMYGPFTTTAEVSAAMYAVTSHLVKYQDE